MSQLKVLDILFPSKCVQFSKSQPGVVIVKVCLFCGITT